MKKIFTCLLSVIVSLGAYAQITDGYYRLKCKQTGRYIAIHNDYVNKESAKRTGNVDLQSLETIEDFDEVVNDPGSIIYMRKTPNGWAIDGQGFTTQGKLDLQLTEIDGAYRVWATVTSDGMTLTRYLRDYEDQTGKSYITTDKDKSSNWEWYFVPVEGDNYMGLKGDVKVGSDYYTTIYATFPIQLGSKMKAYTVSSLTTSSCTLEEIGDIVPQYTPAVIKCAGEKASDNKVTPLEWDEETIIGNKLSGEIFCYPVTTPSGKERRDNPAWNTLDYDPETMRVIGESDGKLCFVTSSTLRFIPANTAFLDVPSDAAAVMTTDGSSIKPTPEPEGTTFVEDVDDSGTKNVPVSFIVTTSSSSETPTVAIANNEGITGQFEIPETVTHSGVEYKVTEIAEGAFQNNTALTDITIPASISSINDNAFAGCKNLKSITIYRDEPINLSPVTARAFTRSNGDSVFDGVDKETCILYVPEGSVDKYKAAPIWKEFKNIQAISTTGIFRVEYLDGVLYNVYNLNGLRVKSQATSLDGLPRGIYIINGKKVLKK